jgi:hypothetical protein
VTKAQQSMVRFRAVEKNSILQVRDEMSCDMQTTYKIRTLANVKKMQSRFKKLDVSSASDYDDHVVCLALLKM